MNIAKHGVIDQSLINRKTDYLYRVSIKAVIKDDKGHVLVVKEDGKTWWDLPGGGMDHGDDVRTAIKRELYEEVGLDCNFSKTIIAVEDPKYLEFAGVLQLRLIFEVFPEVLPSIDSGEADEVCYLDPASLKDSDNPVERKVYEYANRSLSSNTFS